MLHHLLIDQGRHLVLHHQLIDQEQQDLYSKNVDPWRDVQVKADLIYASEIQPLQDRIVRIDDEIGSLWEEIQSIERQMRSARRGIEDRERELEDKADRARRWGWTSALLAAGSAGVALVPKTRTKKIFPELSLDASGDARLQLVYRHSF